MHQKRTSTFTRCNTLKTRKIKNDFSKADRSLLLRLTTFCNKLVKKISSTTTILCFFYRKRWKSIFLSFFMYILAPGVESRQPFKYGNRKFAKEAKKWPTKYLY